MLRIAICDDLPRQLEKISGAARQYLDTHPSVQAEIFTYGNPLLLLDQVDRTGGFDILLLDVCMPGIDGTQVAAEIRRRGDSSEIIFLTTSDEFAVDAFALKAAHYLVKPFTQAQFTEAMDRATTRFTDSVSKKMTFYSEGGTLHIVAVDEILYIESAGHSQTAHLKAGVCTETRRSLSRMQEELEKLSKGQFVSPCKGYVVNQRAIRTLEPRQILLQSGQTIPLARGTFRTFSDQYFAYLFPKEERA